MVMEGVLAAESAVLSADPRSFSVKSSNFSSLSRTGWEEGERGRGEGGERWERGEQERGKGESREGEK